MNMQLNFKLYNQAFVMFRGIFGGMVQFFMPCILVGWYQGTFLPLCSHPLLIQVHKLHFFVKSLYLSFHKSFDMTSL